MSYNLEENNPNGKSSQLYYFKHRWEPKHFFGKCGRKYIELKKRAGISNIRDYQRPYESDYNHIIIIDGKPKSVDNLKLEISNILRECQNMYYSNKW